MPTPPHAQLLTLDNYNEEVIRRNNDIRFDGGFSWPAHLEGPAAEKKVRQQNHVQPMTHVFPLKDCTLPSPCLARHRIAAAH